MKRFQRIHGDHGNHQGHGKVEGNKDIQTQRSRADKHHQDAKNDYKRDQQVKVLLNTVFDCRFSHKLLKGAQLTLPGEPALYLYFCYFSPHFPFDSRDFSILPWMLTIYSGKGGRIPFALLVHPVNESQNLRNRLKEIGWDGRTHGTLPQKCPCQGRIFDDGNLMPLCHLLDPFRYHPFPFGQDDRSLHPLLVFQGYRHVGGVRNDNIRPRNGLKHPAPGHLPLNLADSRLDHRIAFTLLELIPDFLLGHLKALFVFPLLVEVIQKGQNNQGEKNPIKNFQSQGPDELQRFHTLHVHRWHQVRKGGFDARISDPSDHQQLYQGFQEFNGGPPGEYFLKTTDGIDVVEFRRKGFCGKQDSDLEVIDQKAHQQNRCKDGRQNLSYLPHIENGHSGDILHTKIHIHVLEGENRHLVDRIHHIGPGIADGRDGRQKDQRRIDFHRTGNLALFTGFLSPSRRRCFTTCWIRHYLLVSRLLKKNHFIASPEEAAPNPCTFP